MTRLCICLYVVWLEILHVSGLPGQFGKNTSFHFSMRGGKNAGYKGKEKGRGVEQSKNGRSKKIEQSLSIFVSGNLV